MSELPSNPSADLQLSLRTWCDPAVGARLSNRAADEIGRLARIAAEVEMMALTLEARDKEIERLTRERDQWKERHDPRARRPCRESGAAMGELAKVALFGEPATSSPPSLGYDETYVRSAPETDGVRAIEDVIAERARQQSVEGWTPEHDDQHEFGELAQAAVCYVAQTAPNLPTQLVKDYWPWDWSWWKPKDRRRDLVRAAALLLAEIERLDRGIKSKSPSKASGEPTSGSGCPACGVMYVAGARHFSGCPLHPGEAV